MNNDLDYIALNASLNIPKDGKIEFHKDKEAVRAYFTQNINKNTVFFHDLEEKIEYLIEEDYYDESVIRNYSWEQIKEIFKLAYSFKYRFKTYVGALKFYTGYALMTRDKERYLERYEDRVVMYALESAGGDFEEAKALLTEVITGRFQPATPTFLNAGKKNVGEKVSCFLIATYDSLDSISKTVDSALKLSARGGGVGISLSNLREAGSPIKGIKGASSGLLPVMKILEDTFTYADQLGQRQGAGAVFVHAHHPDIMKVLDSKRENADEKIRIKTLSLGVVIPDITFELAKNNDDMFLFSPYDVMRVYGKDFTDFSVTEHYEELVKNPEITKTKINAREFFATLAEIQAESGYPYILFEDTANRNHYVSGRISQSNICVEILQRQTPSTFKDGEYDEVGTDISCNLGSMNIAYAMDGRDIAKTVERGVRALTAVSDSTNISVVKTVQNGNRLSHSIGLGQMNLHGFLGREKIHFGSEESIDFVNIYFYTVAFHAVRTSMEIAKERGQTFFEFEKSKYASGEYFNKYLVDKWHPKTDRVKKLLVDYGFAIPTVADWQWLKEQVMKHGIYNAYLQAVPPTGSISYINNATSSIHPITQKIEPRKEGKIGRVYYPAAEMTMDNLEYFETAYQIGWQKLIDVYAAAQEHIDQSISATLFFNSGTTTREINKAQIYAWKKGLKTLYYIRISKENELQNDYVLCSSCAL
jgi:ribonucleoside-diphosphate reductase alpha chain